MKKGKVWLVGAGPWRYRPFYFEGNGSSERMQMLLFMTVL